MDQHTLALWKTKFNQLGMAKVKMAGDSMAPVIAGGDSFYLAKVKPDELKVGDIVTFETHGRLVTHRIVGRTELGRYGCLFWERGDNGRGIGRLPDHAVLGKVIAVKPAGGRLRLMADRPGLTERWGYWPAMIFSRAYALPYYIKLSLLGQNQTSLGRRINRSFSALINWAASRHPHMRRVK